MFNAILSLIAALAIAIVPAIPANWTAYLVIPAFCLGHEASKAESRYAAESGEKNHPFCGFFPSAWTLKELMNWLIPLAISLEVFEFQDVIQKYADIILGMF